MTISSAAEGSNALGAASTVESQSHLSPSTSSAAPGEEQVLSTKSATKEVSSTPSTSSSKASTQSNPSLPPTSDNEESLGTPPLPNGQLRLHPLLDEHQSSGDSESTTVNHQSTLDSTEGKEEKDKRLSMAVVEARAQDVSHQYPSPSSGFVPPVTEEDFSLADVPSAARFKRGNGVGVAEEGIRGITIDNQQSTHQAPPTISESLSESAVALDSESESRQAAKVAAEEGVTTLSIPRRMSTSSSSSFGEGHSQAISARSSPSTVAPRRPQSSTSLPPTQSSSQFDMIPLKVRDYAFSELDPRHVGARDVSAPSPGRDRHSGGMGGGRRWGVNDDDDDDEEEEEEEDEEEEQGPLPLPTGLYHAAYDFDAESEHELSVKAGEKVRLIGHVDGGWAIVVRVEEGKETETKGEEENVSELDKGLVPEAYLEWLG